MSALLRSGKGVIQQSERLAALHEFDSQSVRFDKGAFETRSSVERLDENLVALHGFFEIIAFISDVRLLLENLRKRTAVFEIEPFDGVGLVVEVVDVNLATFEVDR